MVTIILIGIILGPLVLLSLLKVNAVFVYFSLCLGYVLTQFLSSNAQVNNLISTSKLIHLHFNFSNNNSTKLILLLLPVVLTIIFMMMTAKSHKFSINSLAALAVGLLGVYLVTPLLPLSTMSVAANTLWVQLKDYQSPIIGISSAVIMVMMLLQRSKTGSSGKHHKGHRE